jgi:periplasmic divalent cation tolerance protein
MSDPLVALVTCPNSIVAGRIAEVLVSEWLAACVNEIPGVTSTYIWEGKLHRDSEVLLLIKATQERWQALENRLKELHPYELPELIALPVCAGSAAYLDWLRQNARAESGA